MRSRALGSVHKSASIDGSAANPLGNNSRNSGSILMWLASCGCARVNNAMRFKLIELLESRWNEPSWYAVALLKVAELHQRCCASVRLCTRRSMASTFSRTRDSPSSQNTLGFSG